MATKILNIKEWLKWIKGNKPQFEILATFENQIISVRRLKDGKVFEYADTYSSKDSSVIPQFFYDNLRQVKFLWLRSAGGGKYVVDIDDIDIQEDVTTVHFRENSQVIEEYSLVEESPKRQT